MCKSLFLEYDRIFISDSQIDVNESTNIIFLGKTNKDFNPFDGMPFPVNSIGIHWFEFTWSILSRLMGKEKSPIKIINIVREFGLVCFNRFNLLHPIDYLYEQFKKLS